MSMAEESPAEESPGEPRVAVIGAGIVGLCTAYALAERGVPLRVYDSGPPGNGQSGGESRLFRHAHDDPRLVEFTRQSRAIWDEWSGPDRLGIDLVSEDGVVALGPRAEERLRILRQVDGIPVRMIDMTELSLRMPLLAEYRGPAMLDERGGAIRTRAAVAALSRRLGESLVTDEVISLRHTGRGTVEVRTGGDRSQYSGVVVCAGLGTARLARGIGLALPVRSAAHVRITFQVKGLRPVRVACLQDSSGEWGEVGVYGAPYPGNRAYGVGLSQTVDVRGDGSLVDPAALAALGDRAGAYVARALPGLVPEPAEFRHCWVTHLPWGDDGLGVWEADGVLFVVGHNLFKQAPGLGRALARAVTGDGLMDDLRPESRLGGPR